MSRRTRPVETEYAVLRLSDYALTHERAETLRRRPGRPSRQPECILIGHAWSQDPAREGGLLCLVCAAIRHP